MVQTVLYSGHNKTERQSHCWTGGGADTRQPVFVVQRTKSCCQRTPGLLGSHWTPVSGPPGLRGTEGHRAGRSAAACLSPASRVPGEDMKLCLGLVLLLCSGALHVGEWTRTEPDGEVLVLVLVRFFSSKLNAGSFTLRKLIRKYSQRSKVRAEK